MESLFNVREQYDGISISARELHKHLEITERFNNWFDRLIKYGFDENADYIGCKVFNTLARKELQDYYLTVDMAKEIAMLQRNDKGKEIRKKLIELEKAWNSPERVMARALRLANEQINDLIPYKNYTERVLISSDYMTITEIAKEFGESGQWLNKVLCSLRIQYKVNNNYVLYSQYARCGYTSSRCRTLDNGEITHHTYWTQKGKKFIYDLLSSKEIITFNKNTKKYETKGETKQHGKLN